MGRAVVAGYPHRMAGHCGSGAMRDLLEWAGLGYGADPLSEGTVFGLGGVLAFSYVRAPGLGTPIYLVGRGAVLTEQLCGRLGVAVERRSTDDPDQGWAWVREEIDAGRPVLCWVEMAELPYLRVQMRMSRHDIVVIGYDDETGSVVVVDNDRAEPQTISRAALARARSARGFPEPTRHTCYPMKFPTTLPELPVAAAAACSASVESLSGADSPFRPGDGGVAGAGVAGVEAFVADLDRWDDVFDLAELERALFALRVLVEKAGTGGGLFRRLQAEFLADLARRVPVPEVLAARDAYTALAEAWSAAAAAAVGDGPAPERLAAVRRHAAALPGLESDGTAGLVRVAAALGDLR